MHIETHGGFQNPKKETRPPKFCCTNCRCKFVADPGEYIEGKKNTNAIASKDLRSRTKLYVSVCPECNEVVPLPGSCARFVNDPIDPIYICSHKNQKIKVVSERPNIPTGIYEVIEYEVETVYGISYPHIKITLSLANCSCPDQTVHFQFDSNDPKGIKFYPLDEE